MQYQSSLISSSTKQPKPFLLEKKRQPGECLYVKESGNSGDGGEGGREALLLLCTGLISEHLIEPQATVVAKIFGCFAYISSRNQSRSPQAFYSSQFDSGANFVMSNLQPDYNPKRSRSQSINQLINQSINQSYQSINQSINQSIISINQAINQASKQASTQASNKLTLLKGDT